MDWCKCTTHNPWLIKLSFAVQDLDPRAPVPGLDRPRQGDPLHGLPHYGAREDALHLHPEVRNSHIRARMVLDLMVVEDIPGISSPQPIKVEAASIVGTMATLTKI